MITLQFSRSSSTDNNNFKSMFCTRIVKALLSYDNKNRELHTCMCSARTFPVYVPFFSPEVLSKVSRWGGFTSRRLHSARLKFMGPITRTIFSANWLFATKIRFTSKRFFHGKSPFRGCATVYSVIPMSYQIIFGNCKRCRTTFFKLFNAFVILINIMYNIIRIN